MSKRARTIARVHKILGLVVGVQLLFWTLSGFYFTLVPIETIRGEHLRRAPTAIDPSTLGAVAMPALPSPADTLEIRMLLGEPVWFAKGQNGAGFFSLETGAVLPALNEADIRQIAEAGWAGEGKIASVERVENPPREAFSKTPLWRVQFDGRDRATVWVDAAEGRISAVRTGKWRLFDVLWRFHIMDVTGDDRFDSWWLKLAAFLGLTTVLCGMALLVHRASRGRLFK